MAMIQTEHYHYTFWKKAPLDLTAAPGLEVGLSEPVARLQAGRWYLNDPRGEWAQIDADQIVRAPVAEWVLARLLWLIREVDPGAPLADFVVVGVEQRARFPLRVVSQLSRSARDPGATIRVVIDECGAISPWHCDE